MSTVIPFPASKTQAFRDDIDERYARLLCELAADLNVSGLRSVRFTPAFTAACESFHLNRDERARP